jgi:very-short-patch-repair endonuclease
VFLRRFAKFLRVFANFGSILPSFEGRAGDGWRIFLNVSERNYPKVSQRVRKYAKQNRNEPTNAETILWNRLKNSQTGFKFSRQIVIGNYIADFCCRSHKVVVELDGDSHEKLIEEDLARDEYMTKLGYLVLRIANSDVYDHLDEVVEHIRCACEDRPQWRY